MRETGEKEKRRKTRRIRIIRIRRIITQGRAREGGNSNVLDVKGRDTSRRTVLLSLLRGKEVETKEREKDVKID